MAQVQETSKLKGRARSFLNSMPLRWTIVCIFYRLIYVAKLQKWTEQIKVLKDNEWIEALLLGLEQYNFIHAGESRNNGTDTLLATIAMQAVI